VLRCLTVLKARVRRPSTAVGLPDTARGRRARGGWHGAPVGHAVTAPCQGSAAPRHCWCERPSENNTHVDLACGWCACFQAGRVGSNDNTGTVPQNAFAAADACACVHECAGTMSGLVQQCRESRDRAGPVRHFAKAPMTVAPTHVHACAQIVAMECSRQEKAAA